LLSSSQYHVYVVSHSVEPWQLEDYQPPCHLQMELQNRDIYSVIFYWNTWCCNCVKSFVLLRATICAVACSITVPRGFHQSEETIPHLGTLHKDMFLYQLLSTKGTRNPRVPLQIKRLSDPRKQFYAVQDLPLKRSIISNVTWIKACMKDREYVSEELYEISIDVHGTRQGPFTGRQRALNKEPKLFSGLKFYNRELGLISLFQEVSKQGLVCSKYCIRSKLQPRNQVHKTILLESNHILCNSIGKRVTYFDHSCSTSLAVI
ncbi:hypothetical protein HID58_042803, partial [Brassica napus]